jgi:hypothetical protein
LPPALQDLWWKQQLPPEDVPWVLHQIEPSPQIDIKSLQEVQGKFVLGLAWVVCVAIVIGWIGSGNGGALFNEASGVICLLLAVGPALLMLELRRSARVRERSVKLRVLALLQERTASFQQPREQM